MHAEDIENGDNTDQDLSVTISSDVDSSGDSKVVAKSVEGEDDMVDVTMKDADDAVKPPKNIPMSARCVNICLTALG